MAVRNWTFEEDIEDWFFPSGYGEPLHQDDDGFPGLGCCSFINSGPQIVWSPIFSHTVYKGDCLLVLFKFGTPSSKVDGVTIRLQAEEGFAPITGGFFTNDDSGEWKKCFIYVDDDDSGKVATNIEMQLSTVTDTSVLSQIRWDTVKLPYKTAKLGTGFGPIQRLEGIVLP